MPSLFDPRHIVNGGAMPSKTYCGQVYVVKAGDGAWIAAMTTGSGK